MTAEELSKLEHVNVEEQGNLYRLTTDTGYVFIIGENKASVIHCIKTAELGDCQVTEATTENIVEVVIVKYEEEVNRLIRLKYSLSEELSILRQKESKQDEYNEYYNYCEECKSLAKDYIASKEEADAILKEKEAKIEEEKESEEMPIGE